MLLLLLLSLIFRVIKESTEQQDHGVLLCAPDVELNAALPPTGAILYGSYLMCLICYASKYRSGCSRDPQEHTYGPCHMFTSLACPKVESRGTFDSNGSP